MRHMDMDTIMETNFDQFETRTGLIVQVRQMNIEDAPYLVDLFENMGSDSQYESILAAGGQHQHGSDLDRSQNIAHQAGGTNFGLVAFADIDEREGVPGIGVLDM